MPLWGRGYRILVNLRFARTLAMVLRGGVSVIDGLVLAGRATGSPWVEELAEAEARAVRHGGRRSDSVGRIPPLAGSLPGWIRAGEASGGLPRLMESAGDRCQAHWQRFAGRCLGILEPALILVIGAFVLLIASAILLPIVTLSRALGP